MKLRIHLEDHHQDFLSFTLNDGVIEGSNMQGQIWDGKRVVNENIKPGDSIEFDDGMVLRYAVKTVSVAD